MKKILIALDGSQVSESILPYVEALLLKVDANVTLATVLEEATAAERIPAEGYLSEVADWLTKKGAFVDVKVLEGDPAAEIARLARTGSFDLVALCSRGKTGVRRLLLGSVAEEILRLSVVPVLVVRPRDPAAGPVRLARIAVPLDGSHRSASVLGPAAALAQAFGARLDFVNVVNSTHEDLLPVEVAAANLFRQQKKLLAAGLAVDTVVLFGDPAAEIMRYARKSAVDLVAISTHGRRGLNRAIYGSVAEKILRKTTIPLLVVRTAAIVRDHPMHRRGAEARKRALKTLASAPDASRGPYSG